MSNEVKIHCRKYEVAPCPFCGALPIVKRNSSNGCVYLGCGTDYCTMKCPGYYWNHFVTANRFHELVARWNKRTWVFDKKGTVTLNLTEEEDEQREYN